MKKEIKITKEDNLDSVVYMLLAAKSRGEQAYCNFYGHILESNYISIDSAYKKVYGHPKEEYEKLKRLQEDNYQKNKVTNNVSQEEYQKVIDSRKNTDHTITEEKVINGIKFIIENQSINQEELISGLVELGCNFTINDVSKQFNETIRVKDGIKTGNIACGAVVIINMRDSDYGRTYCTENFLVNDDDTSLYNYIRLLTNDMNYTKDNVINNKTI